MASLIFTLGITLLGIFITPALAAEPPMGCDSLQITFRGSSKTFGKEMDEVEKRIEQICDQKLKSIDEKIKKIGNECAGSTAGQASDFDVSIDLRVKNFQDRSAALCKFLKSAKERIRPKPESFCGQFATVGGATASLFVGTNEQNLLGDKKDILARLNDLKSKHEKATNNYSQISQSAKQVQAPIDRALPPQVDAASQHTEDRGLRNLLDLTEKARAGRESQVKADYQKLAGIVPAPADRDKKVSEMRASAKGCQQLKSALVQYKELMENNLLPNGRRMSKLLSAASEATAKESEKHKQAASKMQETIARLDSKITPVDGTGKPLAVAEEPRVVTPLAGDQPLKMANQQQPKVLEKRPSFTNTPFQTKYERVGGSIRPVEYYLIKGEYYIYVR